MYISYIYTYVSLLIRCILTKDDGHFHGESIRPKVDPDGSQPVVARFQYSNISTLEGNQTTSRTIWEAKSHIPT